MADDPELPFEWKCANPIYQKEMTRLLESLQAMRETEKKLRGHLERSGVADRGGDWGTGRADSPAALALSRLLGLTVKPDSQALQQSKGHLPPDTHEHRGIGKLPGPPGKLDQH